MSSSRGKSRRLRKPLVARFDEMDGVPCPCGTARRAFVVPGNETASVHRVVISKAAERHHHTRHTEIYVVLKGKGVLELDRRRVALRPGTAVLIPPGVVHRAVGRLTILNVSVPTFDPADEHVVKERTLRPAKKRRRAGRPQKRSGG